MYVTALATGSKLISGDLFLLQPLGYQIVAILGLLMLAREVFLVIQGQPANFVKVVTRVLWAVLFIRFVPTVADGLASGIDRQASSLLGERYHKMISAVRTIYANHGSCPTADESWFESLAQVWIFDMSVIISLLMAFVALLLLIVKVAVIDIAWKIQLSVILVAAPIVLAVGTLEEFGGFAHFWRTVLSILAWPLIFAILIIASDAIVGADFETIKAHDQSLFCSIELATQDGLSAQSAQAAFVQHIRAKTVQTTTSFRIIATMLVLLVLTLKVPTFSSSLFGAGSAGAFGGAAMGAMVGSAGGALRGVAMAAGGGTALQVAAATFNMERFVRGGRGASSSQGPAVASPSVASGVAGGAQANPTPAGQSSAASGGATPSRAAGESGGGSAA